MVLALYSLGIRIYGLILSIASLFSAKAKLLIEGRKESIAVIQSSKQKYPEAKWIWIHAASLGEFEQGRYLIEQLKLRYPEYRIALSFYSPSGFIPRQHYDNADAVFYMPLDTYSEAKALLNTLSPTLAIFIKYDFWWNHLKALQDYSIPTVFISSIIRSDQYFIKRSLGDIRNILTGISHFYVQTPESKQELNQIGIDHVTVCGDSRLDSIVNEEKPALAIHDDIKQWKGHKKCIIYGSVHLSDLPVLQSMTTIKDTCHLIVPHDVDEVNVIAITNQLNNAEIYTDVGLEEHNTIVLNKTGVLKYIYDLADVVYIGGGFGHGIHNTLEPLIHLKPIIIGPNYQKFPEAVTLINLDVMKTVCNSKEAIDAAISNISGYNEINKKRLKNYIKLNTGATEIIFRSLEKNKWI